MWMLLLSVASAAPSRAEFCLIDAVERANDWRIDWDCGSGGALTGPLSGEIPANLPDVLVLLTDAGWKVDQAWAAAPGPTIHHYFLLRHDLGLPIPATAPKGNTVLAERICRKVYAELGRDPGAAWDRDVASVTAFLDAGFTEADALAAITRGRAEVQGTVPIADYLYAGATPE